MLTKMEIGAARDNGQKWCTLVWSWKHRSIKERNNEKKKKKKAHALSWNRRRDSRMVMHACLELREKLEHWFGVIKERRKYKKKRKRNKYLCGLWLIWSHRREGNAEVEMESQLLPRTRDAGCRSLLPFAFVGGRYKSDDSSNLSVNC